MNKEPTLREAIIVADITSIEYKLYHIGVVEAGVSAEQINRRLAELSEPIAGRPLGWRRVISRFLREQQAKLASSLNS